MKYAIATCLLGTLLAPVSVIAEERALSDAEWRADIEQMVEAIKTIHFKAFHNITEEEFDRDVEILLNQLGQASDEAIVLDMARIVAKLGDGHTRLHIPRVYPELALEAELGHAGTPPPKIESLGFAQLPVRFDLFDDGLFVVGAVPEHSELIGRRVVAFDDTPVEEAIEAVRPVIFTENDSRAKLMTPDRLALPAVLAHLGVIENRDRLSLVTVGPEGESRATPIEALTEAGRSFEWDLPAVPPAWQRHRDKFRWYEALPDQDAIYVQVNQFEEAPVRPYSEFVAETLRAAREAGVSRYVLDLRHNTGGIGSWTTSFVTGLSRSEYNEYGRLYVLMGRTTFSAAQHLLHKFEELTYALFVGEPSGAKPSHYGDGRRVVLDNSGLTVRVSTIYWHSWLANDFRDAIKPHLPVEMRSGDHFSGRDPALEAVVSYRPPATLAAQIEEQFRQGANQNALLLFTRFMSDATRDDHETVAPALREMADRIAEDGFARPGFFVYLLLDMTFPGDPETQAGRERLEALQE